MEKPTIDIVWVLVSAGLVFLMQAGFMCLESGLTRSKNSINVAIKNLTDFGISFFLYWMFGFALMFGLTWSGWFGTTHFFLSTGEGGMWLSVFFLFQAMFCGTSTTIVSGAAAERLRFGSYIVITILLSGLIYPLFGHWAWGGVYEGDDGWLRSQGFVDFAGSTVVHSVGAWVSLAVVVIVGPRKGRFPKDGPPRKIPGHNISMAVLGVLLLWFGWFGFNGGSAFKVDGSVAVIISNTILAGVAGLITALGIGWPLRGRPDVELVINGALAGLVAITASCYFVDPVFALLIGGVGGGVMLFGTYLLERLRIDDSVGAIPVHGFAGVWGTLAVALFGKLELLDTGLSFGDQLLIQVKGIGIAFLWAFGVAYLLLYLFNRFFRLRVSAEAEHIGLNVSEHGATTEFVDLLQVLDDQAKRGDLSLRAPVEPFTEIGQIATRYNQVMEYLEESTIHEGQLEDIVNERTHELMAKNKQIMESITYASTIQLAILPETESINESCKEHFVIWKPRDSVGGDFYWFERVDDHYLIAVVDCTGHGVPGAFMTMIANSALNRVVGEICNDDPARILKELNIIVRRTLNQNNEYSESSISLRDDGMDIALCYVHPKRNELIFSGARISLYHCKNHELMEIKGDKQSVGYKSSREDFDYTNHKIKYEKDEVFYLTSDGLLDQNGSDKRSPFGKKRFKGLILKNYDKPLEEQKNIINRTLSEYQAGEPQRDDITVIGFKV